MNIDLPIEMFDMPRGRKTAPGAMKRVVADTHTSVLVRMPKTMKAQLKSFSRAGYRTVTAEILWRLAASLEGESINEHGVIVSTPARVKSEGQSS